MNQVRENMTMNNLIKEINNLDLQSINALIPVFNARMKALRNVKQAQAKAQFSVGDSVFFTSRGQKVTGKVIKIMPKNIKVETMNGLWKVAPSLLSAA